MKIKYLVLFFLIINVFTLCISKKENNYYFKSKKRVLELNFLNDSICIYKNTFSCKDIDSNIRVIEIQCKYIKNEDFIILENLNCNNANSFYIEYSPQKSNDCKFLNKNNINENQIKFGGQHTISDNYISSLIPNIDVDTLYIYNKRLFLLKIGNVKSQNIIIPFKKKLFLPIWYKHSDCPK